MKESARLASTQWDAWQKPLSQVLGDLFSGTYSFLIPGIFESMGKLRRGFVLLLTCLRKA